VCAENDVEFLGAAVFFPTPVFLERVVRLIAIFSMQLISLQEVIVWDSDVAFWYGHPNTLNQCPLLGVKRT
jgi:hypothetical protein